MTRHARRYRVKQRAGGSIATLPAATGKGDRVGTSVGTTGSRCRTKTQQFGEHRSEQILRFEAKGFQAEVDLAAIAVG